jgi:cellulose synthase/poly-beta-1,6-N-acetylglucosamine synthase-like glycosyltransferase
MILLAVLYFCIYFGIFSAMLFLLFRSNWQQTLTIPPQKVKVSILIAARNEAANIERCLIALTKLNYPPELLEVLVGDDNSTDNTFELVQEFIADKPNFNVFRISENLGQALGKGNVLAHLAKKATADLFFITDADIAVPPLWVKAMLAELKPEIGIVTGITTVDRTDLFSRMQALDWIQSLGFIQIVSDLDLPVSTMGNNMLITRKAYESTGGYENLPFSITEDIQLFNEVLKNAFGSKNVYRKEVLALSQPAEDVWAFLHQRKRWMRGTVHLPKLMKTFLIIYAAFYVFLIPVLILLPLKYAIGIFVLKLIFQSIFIAGCLHKLNRKIKIADLFLFEFYQVFTAVTLLAFFYLPIKVKWKGREY